MALPGLHAYFQMAVRFCFARSRARERDCRCLAAQRAGRGRQIIRDANGDALVQLPIAEPNDYATVVMLDVKGAARVITRSIGANADGVIILEAESADIHGAPLRVSARTSKPGILDRCQKLRIVAGQVRQTRSLSRGCTYGCKSSEGGGDYTIEIAGKQLMATATATKDWFSRRTDRIGIIEVGTAQGAGGRAYPQESGGRRL